MTNTQYRSRSYRRDKTTTPGHNKVVHYRRKKPSCAKCGISGDKLSGLPLLRSSYYSRLSKSKKRINRKYGGVYSPKVVRLALKKAIWLNQ